MPCPECNTDNPPRMPKDWISYIDQPVCQVCEGKGYLCEFHPDKPMDHLLKNGRSCPHGGVKCNEPGCPGALQKVN